MKNGQRAIMSIALLLLAMAVSVQAAQRLVLFENQTNTG
jgi:hypothetical protein